MITYSRAIIFIQDNVPSHIAHETTKYLQQLSFCGPRKMKWLANSSDLHSVKNVWGILKRPVYENRRQFVAGNSEYIMWNHIRGDAKIDMIHGPAPYFNKESEMPD